MRQTFLLLLVALGGLTGTALAQSPVWNQGYDFTWDEATDMWTLSWMGESGHTYFIQVSLDLATWFYVDEIEPGNGDAIEYEFAASADRYFLRLRRTDQPTIDPNTDDFDGDGLSNADELTLDIDPLDTDTDGDGISDKAEVVSEWGAENSSSFPITPARIRKGSIMSIIQRVT